MPMREDCRHFESRTYDNGEVARYCVLGLAPEQPWRCPEHCDRYEPTLLEGGMAVLKRERDENWPRAPRIFTRLGTPIKDFRAAWDVACERAGAETAARFPVITPENFQAASDYQARRIRELSA